MRLNKKHIVVLMFLALLTIQTTIVAKTNPKQSNVLAEISFEKDEGAIFLPVTLEGKKYLFLLDTGASYNVYDLSLKKYMRSSLGVTNVTTSSGTANVSMFKSPDAQLGSLSLKTKEPVGCYDFLELSYVIGRRIYGMIGMSFLRKYAVKIDFDNNKIVFYKHLKKVNANGYTLFPTRYGDKQIPWLRAIVPGGRIWFLIDTGDNSNGSLSKIIFDSLVEMNKISRMESSHVQSLNEITTNREGVLSSFSLGSFVDNDLRVSSSMQSRIGIAYLSRYSVLFDFPNSKIYLKKRKAFRKDVICKVGVSLIRKDGKNIVYVIKKGSPAEKSGVKKSDILLAVDGKNTNKFTLYMLRRYLMKPGQILQMKISRKGKIMKLQLKPEVY